MDLGKVVHQSQRPKLSQRNQMLKNVSLKKENGSLRQLYLDKKSWEGILADACITANEGKLVIDLLGLFNQPKMLQFEVLKNLIGKMKSKTNHRYTCIIKDISALHKNSLGQTNYSLLQDLLGLCGKTTATITCIFRCIRNWNKPESN